MEKCKTCRFYQGKCVKYPVNVNEECKACNDYAAAKDINESVPVRMQLND